MDPSGRKTFLGLRSFLGILIFIGVAGNASPTLAEDTSPPLAVPAPIPALVPSVVGPNQPAVEILQYVQLYVSLCTTLPPNEAAKCFTDLNSINNTPVIEQFGPGGNVWSVNPNEDQVVLPPIQVPME